MYARIVQVPLLPGTIAEATDYFRQSVGPALKGHAGFQNSRFLVDEEKNCCLMVTLWESAQTQAEAETNTSTSMIISRNRFDQQPLFIKQGALHLWGTRLARRVDACQIRELYWFSSFYVELCFEKATGNPICAYSFASCYCCIWKE